MKNRGFTLVELYTVISILSILVIISIPNVIELFRQSEQNSFENELKTIYREANQEWILDSMFESSEAVYMSCNGVVNANANKDGSIIVFVNNPFWLCAVQANGYSYCGVD